MVGRFAAFGFTGWVHWFVLVGGFYGWRLGVGDLVCMVVLLGASRVVDDWLLGLVWIVVA